MCLFFSILNFDYFIRKVKQTHDKLRLMELKSETQKLLHRICIHLRVGHLSYFY